VYVPIVANGQVLGCLAVDNLLSQQLIDEEQMDSLRSLVGQIGMAILNARLFEDIEAKPLPTDSQNCMSIGTFNSGLKKKLTVPTGIPIR
jgi:K+-sensing histidine kinase KdpD